MPDFAEEADKLLKTISSSYAKAPCFKKVFPLMEEIIRFPDHNLAGYAENSIRKICAYLNITTPILLASDLAVDACFKRRGRVIQTQKD